MGVGFIYYLTMEEATERPGTLAYSTVEAYFQEVSRALARPFNGTKWEPFHGPDTTDALRGAAKLLGTETQKARPITIRELQQLVEGLDRGSLRDATFHFIVVAAFFGAFRLGNIAQAPGMSPDKVVTLLDVEIVDQDTIRIRLRYGKTNQTRARIHVVELRSLPPGLESVCPVRAFTNMARLREYCLGSQAHHPVARYGTGTMDYWTRDQVIDRATAIVPVKASTPYEKGHITGHSFRRGFVKYAIEKGIRPELILLHGDWKELATVQAYAAGAATTTMRQLIEAMGTMGV